MPLRKFLLESFEYMPRIAMVVKVQGWKPFHIPESYVPHGGRDGVVAGGERGGKHLVYPKR